MDGLCSEWTEEDGILPTCEIRVIQFIDTDGNTGYKLKHCGNVPLSTYVGLLTMAQWTLAQSFDQEVE